MFKIITIMTLNIPVPNLPFELPSNGLLTLENNIKYTCSIKYKTTNYKTYNESAINPGVTIMIGRVTGLLKIDGTIDYNVKDFDNTVKQSVRSLLTFTDTKTNIKISGVFIFQKIIQSAWSFDISLKYGAKFEGEFIQNSITNRSDSDNPFE